MQRWENIANVRFTQSLSTSGASLVFLEGTLSSSGTRAVTDCWTNNHWLATEEMRNVNWGYSEIIFNKGYYGVLPAETACHEVGHALGLTHSVTNVKTIMYWAYSQDRPTSPSPQDINTINHLY